MEEGGEIDLSQFRLWYQQAGTPHVRALLHHDPAAQTVTLLLEQTVPPTPGQPEKRPMAIPLRTALFDPETGRNRGDELLMLRETRQSFTFEGWATAPILSSRRRNPPCGR